MAQTEFERNISDLNPANPIFSKFFSGPELHLVSWLYSVFRILSEKNSIFSWKVLCSSAYKAEKDGVPHEIICKSLQTLAENCFIYNLCRLKSSEIVALYKQEISKVETSTLNPSPSKGIFGTLNSHDNIKKAVAKLAEASGRADSLKESQSDNQKLVEVLEQRQTLFEDRLKRLESSIANLAPAKSNEIMRANNEPKGRLGWPWTDAIKQDWPLTQVPNTGNLNWFPTLKIQ